MENLKLKPIPKSKGLVFKIAMDSDYAGFYFNYSKNLVGVCLGFIAFRLYFMSEAKLTYALTLANLEEVIEGYDFKITKAENNQSEQSENKGEDNE